MVFEDVHTYNAPTYSYPVCNENIPTWKKALEGIRVERAAGICSGGEVAFFCLLPLVSKSLTLIDHAYEALYYAIGKYHLIERQGSVKALEALQKARVVNDDSLAGVFEEANKGLPTHKMTSSAIFSRGHLTIWNEISKEDVVGFRKNRAKVDFLHGDLDDLVEKGPFDLVYLSNALDYTGRGGKPHKFREMLRPGGYLLYTQGWKGAPVGLEEFTPIKDVKPEYPNRQTTGINWHHIICKAPE